MSALAYLAACVFGGSGSRPALIWGGAIGMVVAYVAHRITSWVVAGFFCTVPMRVAPSFA